MIGTRLFKTNRLKKTGSAMRDGVRLRLCVMMFLQYAVWGAWGVSIGGYMNHILQFNGTQVGLIFSTTAVGAMISPLFVGYVADRFFATERILAFLHGVGGILLLLAPLARQFTHLYPLMQIYALCYMPTLALTNSISFSNIADSRRDFPGIRVWGTWGWIAAGLVIGWIGGESIGQFLVAGILSLVLAGFCLLLPHTPPRARSAEAEAAPRGESVLRLLTDPTFLVFVICSFLICIPLSFYYALANVFLVQLNEPNPTALQTIGQLSEVGFMAAMPFFITRLGVKRMLTVGMLAWVLRYLAFSTLWLPAIVFGLFLHGVCYDFYFVASYIYVDTRVNEKQRASAQGFIAFVMLGLGMFVGSIASGRTADAYPPTILVKASVTSTSGPTRETQLPLPDWDEDGKSPFAKALGLKPGSLVRPEMIRAEFVETNPDEGTTTRFDHSSLVEGVMKADRDNNGAVSRAEWMYARRNQWPFIWLWPAAAALVTCILFVVGFRERVSTVGEEHVGFQAVPEEAEP